MQQRILLVFFDLNAKDGLFYNISQLKLLDKAIGVFIVTSYGLYDWAQSQHAIKIPNISLNFSFVYEDKLEVHHLGHRLIFFGLERDLDECFSHVTRHVLASDVVRRDSLLCNVSTRVP